MSNASEKFKFLNIYDPLLYDLLVFAEGYPEKDPHASLIRLRQFGELLARLWANKLNVFTESDESYCDLLERLDKQNKITTEICNGFNILRMDGNNALHFFEGSSKTVGKNIGIAKTLAIDFDTTFSRLSGKEHREILFDPSPDLLKGNLITGEINSQQKKEKLEDNSDKADYIGKDLTGYDFSEIDLRGYDFTGACLIKAKFCLSNLKDVSFRGADLRETDFRGAKNLQSSQLESTMRNKKTVLPDNLQKGL